MQRDMELVRRILLEVEKSDEILTHPIKIDGYEDPVVNYHIVLMYEAGLLKAGYRNTAAGIPIVVSISRLTWEGHEFLDAAKNEGVWKEVKETLKEKGVDGTFELIKKIAGKLLEKKFNSLFEEGTTLELE